MNAGRDHWPRANSMLFAGGGIPGGQVVGKTDKDGAEPVGVKYSPDDVSASLLTLLGIDHDPLAAYDDFAAESLKIVSSAFLGLSVGCARCHDHRYDPISQEDYYRLRAVFEPGFAALRQRPPRERFVSLFTDADRERAKQLEAEARQTNPGRHYSSRSSKRNWPRFPKPTAPRRARRSPRRPTGARSNNGGS